MKAYSPDPYANDETERWNGLLCPMSNHDPSTLLANVRSAVHVSMGEAGVTFAKP
jgi:hypothetical protein